MGMPAAETLWTVEMVHALPDDGKRYETVDGELFVTPAPTYAHQRAVAALNWRLDAYLRAQGAGFALLAPADVVFNGRTVVQPDVFAVPPHHGKAPANWEAAVRMLLAVEVLSPGTARADRVQKLTLYRREAVPEYWIVDVDARVVERWRLAEERPEILTERVTWQPEGASEPFTLELAHYWHEVFG